MIGAERDVLGSHGMRLSHDPFAGLARITGPEPSQPSLSAMRFHSGVERVMGIEPTLVAWEATVLPLNYTRAGERILCMRTGERQECRVHELQGVCSREIRPAGS